MTIRRTHTLVALAAAALTLAAAGTASAEPNKTPPAKKGCEVQLKGPGAGQSVVYADGYSFSVQGSNDGKKHTYTCNDGVWTETVSITVRPPTWHNVAIVGRTAGTLRAVRLS